MIAANEAVAHFMEERGVPFIYRIHEPPKKEAIDEFRRFISHLGYKMRKEPDHSPKEFQRILSDTRGRPEERVVNEILLRSMKWAKYSAKILISFLDRTPFRRRWTIRSGYLLIGEVKWV